MNTPCSTLPLALLTHSHPRRITLNAFIRNQANEREAVVGLG
jgi:hypothetical protein